MKYQIRYKHTSWDQANSIAEAKRAVRIEGRVKRLYTAEVPDGIYCYLSLEDLKRDNTGERAFAVICRPDDSDMLS